MRTGRHPAARAAATTAALGLALGALSGCGEDSEGPETAGATLSDVQALEERVDELEGQLGTLQGSDVVPGGDSGTPGAIDGGFYDDPVAELGQEVTVSGEVASLWNEDGTAFRLGEEGGDEAISVVAETPITGLEAGSIVLVTGTVTEILRDDFAEDFGLDPEMIFADPEAFFSAEEGQVGIAATEVEIVE